MSDFHQVASVDEISDPGHLLVEVDDRFVIVFRNGDRLSCIDDVCTHDGGPLSEGEFDGECISCPRHGARFDVATGKAVTMPATQDTYAHEVKIEDNAIFVRINPECE